MRTLKFLIVATKFPSSRSDSGNVSGKTNITANSIRKPIVNKITNTKRHEAKFKTIPIYKGAKIGAAAFTSASIAMNFVSSLPEYISREDARAITIPAAAERPWINLSPTNNQIVPLNTARIDEAAYIVNVTSSGRFRPAISLNGPNTNCPSPSPIKVAVTHNRAREAAVLKSLDTLGNQSKYIYIDNVPKAVNDTNIS